MKKLFITGFLLCFFTTSVFLQDAEHTREGPFLKRIEHNLYEGGKFNLAGKSALEKRFFGDFNARIEFFNTLLPCLEEVSGFRIVKKDSAYILEVKYVSNFEEARKMLKDSFVSYDQFVEFYDVATCSVPVSNHFWEELYQKMVSVIVNYKVTEVDKSYERDGYVIHTEYSFSGCSSATFRAVIKAELWSLWVSFPNKDARKMEKLCREIINDVRANKFSESKYISELNAFEN